MKMEKTIEKIKYEKIVDADGVGRRVRQEREKKGWTLKDVVSLCGYSYTRLVALELGRIRLKKNTGVYDFLRDFSKVTDKPVAYYLYGDDRRQVELFLERYFQPFLEYFYAHGEYGLTMVLDDFVNIDYTECTLSELIHIAKGNLFMCMRV